MNNSIKDKLESEASYIRQYIAFDGSGNDDHTDQAKMQSMGVASLWHRIQEDGFAYLADEVGMGKTRQAMGVIATQFLIKPDSRVVVICPGRPLQEQWKSEWNLFVSGCLRVNDGILKSALDNSVSKPLALHNRLSEFASSLLLDDDRIHLLRYSSFSRPIGFNGKDSQEQIKTLYKQKLNEIGIADINAKEDEIFNSVDMKSNDWKKGLTACLNTQYAEQIQTLFNEDTRHIDLIVCDEAQYLRHTRNSRNRHLNLSLASKPNKWLFLSATPLHSGQSDIKSLDYYICTHERDSKTLECAIESCVNISARMKGTFKGQSKTDVIDVLDDFLVRRPRHYSDSANEDYDKVSYRSYKTDAAIATNDAFSSMVTALVQKRLVKSLTGKNNRFRQGECSSFESLASSVKNIVRKNIDGISYTKTEMEPSGGVSESDVPPDRGDIDQLNKSLRQVLIDNKLATESDVELKNIPHPKLYHVADQLVEKSLKNAPNHKTLVFVRRLATVEELIDLLKQRFQKLIDKRIDDWPSIIDKIQLVGGNKPTFSGCNDFWNMNDPDEDAGPIQVAQENGDSNFIEPDLSYYKAISQKSDKQERNGMLYSFLTRLLQPTSNDGKRKSPLAFLVPNEEEQYKHWESPLWHSLLDAIFDEGEKKPDWLKQQEYTVDILMLKRCILQSMRRSDLLVDLYILNGFINIEGINTLSEKLIWILRKSKDGQLKSISIDLHKYLNNWRQRLKQWCIHFELIKSKCFKSNITDIDAEFSRMGPVVGRSGNISNKYAVTQFKMPCYPNILICTDVLKEGVDMHLFCDEVIHYGVAWTSGDLEQRIGRVDRVNSLINRRINQHSGDRDSAPKLKAGFPYLAGTLDQYQVIRVVNEKMLSDLRMDFGKRENEIKDISVDDIFNNSASKKELTLTLKTRTFIPKSLLLEKALLKDNNFPYRDCSVHEQLMRYESKQKKNINVKDIYPLPALVVEHTNPKIQSSYNKILGDNLKTKWEYKKVKGKMKWIENYEVVIPLSLSDKEMDSVVAGFGRSNCMLEPTPIFLLPEAKSFEFNKTLNTLAMIVTHEAPFKQTIDRKQMVMLERIGNLLLVRSPIVSIEDLGLDDKELAVWIGKQNNNRKWGYINDHKDVIWYCCLIAYPEKFGATFDKLTHHISATADRLQQLYTAQDKERWTYKAKNSFKLMKGTAVNNDDIIKKIRVDNSFRSGIARWYKDVFEQVVTRLAENVDVREGHVTEVLNHIFKSDKLLRDGTINLSMPEKPALRFCLQSFLDMSNNSIAGMTPVEPMIVWELGISTSTKGRPPRLIMDDYQDLPHMEDCGNWSVVETFNSVKVYTCQDDEKQMRWFVIYHPASILDGRIELFLNSWIHVLQRMKGNTSKFMKQACANDFKDFSIDGSDKFVEDS
ncbi:DEAD/DEAH box helicase [Moritella sp. Urea-trap-13]|uniref:DEAD/DEAH box helicase n=1 Tax=Moritella sp. Urea-trap-13 TaxID=2058327 RepID=UPI000C34CE0E|nr:DEAD/DEAH box helicase [Moritella sp. Urea-trap-13]PKH08184.1 hypothetical protein CXF93_05780 [Moritella sp. Urea-trap-13]